jgi:hypothetical protein
VNVCAIEPCFVKETRISAAFILFASSFDYYEATVVGHTSANSSGVVGLLTLPQQFQATAA